VTNDTLDTTGPHEPDLNRLAALAEGALDAVAAEQLRSHLSDCRPCRETAALMARALTGETPRRRSLPPAAGWLALAATLVLATVVGVKVSRVETIPVPAAAPSPAPVVAPPVEATPLPAPLAVAPEVKRGGGERTIGGKTFRLVAGEWIDSAYDATAGLAIVEATGPEARRQLLTEHPALAPYLALGDRMLVVLDGTVYRLTP
jgi:hypothetical protein